MRAAAATETGWRLVRFEHMTTPESWTNALQGVDAVVNCVGILREWRGATFDSVHHRAPAALAQACAQVGMRRLVHVSALGLDVAARSRFIRSKIHGECAIRGAGATTTIVRPSLLDGEGGFGARWIRALARLPVHVVPADAVGRIAALDVRDAGEAIAAACEEGLPGHRDIDLGGSEARTMREHLAALRHVHSPTPAWCIEIPPLAARIASHLCDLLHLSPFSFGHLELLRRENVPAVNSLASLLGRAPRRVGASTAELGSRASASAPLTSPRWRP
jgi:uncharacterized protein YbjT (DUF2867 family)